MDLALQLFGFVILMAGLDRFYPSKSRYFGAFLVGKVDPIGEAEKRELDPSGIVGQSALLILRMFLRDGSTSLFRCMIAVLVILFFYIFFAITWDLVELKAAGEILRNFSTINLITVVVLLLSGSVFLWISIWLFEQIHFVWRTRRYHGAIRISIDLVFAIVLVLITAATTAILAPNAADGFEGGFRDAQALSNSGSTSGLLLILVVLASTLASSAFGLTSTLVHILLILLSLLGIITAQMLTKGAAALAENKSIVETMPFAFVGFWVAVLVWALNTISLMMS